MEKQIETFLAESADINENNIFKRYRTLFPKTMTVGRDVPMVQAYHMAAGYCSFMANGGLGMRPSSLHGAVEDDEDDSGNELDETSATEHDPCSVSRPREVAEKIWQFCGDRIHRDGLLRFPRLRITMALSHICRNLPHSAAEILSRPLDDHLYRTPLDLFKQTLRHMEDNAMISDASSFGDRSSVRGGELEYILHESAGIFLEAVRIEPLNVEYQLWLVGCLASCLLISSGNKIGSGAHLYPSKKRPGFAMTSGPAHEVRVQLKKFSAIRLELSNAVKTLCTLVEHQRSSKAHFSLASLLEWGQVMTLLMDGRSHLLVQIRKLHSIHIGQWLKQETSLFSFTYAERSQKFRDGCFYARRLENDPTNIRYWREMVIWLGKLGSDSSVRDDNDSHRRHCPECSRLCSPRWFDHALISSEKANESWWGSGRTWWISSLLHMVPLDVKRKNDKVIGQVLASLYGRTPLQPPQQVTQLAVPNASLNNARRERKTEAQVSVESRKLRKKRKFPEDVTQRRGAPLESASTSCPQQVPSSAAVVPPPYVPANGLDWLTTDASGLSRDGKQSEVSDQARSVSYEKSLPRTYQEVMGYSETVQNEVDKEPTSPLAEDGIPLKVSCPSLEVAAYRMYIFCHLESVAHQLLEDHVFVLAARCWDGTPGIDQLRENCDELRVLHWFVSMGMNVETILLE
jgi:hypothetical protein